MVRWITFDDETAEAVVTRLRRGAAEIQTIHPLDAALGTADPSIVLLPSRVPGRVLVAHFERRTTPTPEPAGQPDQVAPAPVLRPARKPWWKKLVA